jgi:hypothetical protein
MDPTESVAFIEENGTDLETARLRHILYSEKPDPKVIQSFRKLQKEDGGFSYGLFEGNPSALNSTHGALLRLDELGMLKSSSATRAIEYLLDKQKDDGGWEEDQAISEYNPPSWMSPGNLWARIYLSAQGGFWLEAGGVTNHTAFPKALDFLRKHQQETGWFEGFLHSTWIATSIFLIAGEQYAEIAKKGMKALLTKPLSGWVDSQISWALECFAKAGLPNDEPFVKESLAALNERRGAEGKCNAEDNQANTVGSVIIVLKVFKHYDVLSLT